jgi:L-lactate utilization protein LutB
VARKVETERAQGAIAQQMAALQADRARLAEELDRSAERIASLEAANRDVARRLDVTMDAIRTVLKSSGT